MLATWWEEESLGWATLALLEDIGTSCQLKVIIIFSVIVFVVIISIFI